MTMERGIITIDEYGAVTIPSGEIWMSEMELIELFGVIAPTIRATIKAVYKSEVLKECKVQKYIRLENGYYADVFSFPMIVAIAFRINSYGAEQVLNLLLERMMYERKEKTLLFVGFDKCMMMC
ncbi:MULTISPECIES: hypothetical protein [Bacteroides]|uniref:hypothetical protein n=1 Tax=Bacteroides TaxID=816 RepID=UPI001F915B5F|nr:hypothetical protein [Bacteroides nordii]MCE8463953.1 hypothetical protein [Bacteroides nordii]UYU51073.1 hypothetical protein KQP55_08425 [Bacteroides nordii]